MCVCVCVCVCVFCLFSQFGVQFWYHLCTVLNKVWGSFRHPQNTRHHNLVYSLTISVVTLSASQSCQRALRLSFLYPNSVRSNGPRPPKEPQNTIILRKIGGVQVVEITAARASGQELQWRPQPTSSIKPGPETLRVPNNNSYLLNLAEHASNPNINAPSK